MYFDHSATTPVHPDVQNLINITQKEIYGNPSSPYFPGKKARLLLEKSREQGVRVSHPESKYRRPTRR